ncbi:HD domain-containing protein [Clostridium sporogenes]|uniref:HD domain-containing protein n=1 Tax=Clostridium botulinum TaxID=1491 RepID=UPI000717A301|nr:HD domain-containing protein [Clostridium botulinum]KRU30110.1 HD domain-containing protein [Clostridium sporogenes]KRU33515.1 HD domain-containing protein [Clostridium sporogenes]KRU35824.1 HD domain-containing protein [Clostridium sporogenes]KRU36458.1 HD domain-containing protein [Clostridium sporogenes]MBZ1328864.1 HD domain-containing protein [Clostridium botulinum]
MFSREKAEELLLNNLKSEHLIKHSYAVEAVMRALAKELDPENIDKWGITGLLHDLDADIVDYVHNPHLHGPRAVEILKAEGFGDEDMYNAICAHNQGSGTEIKSKMDQAIYAADPITGFITAITLVYPDKKISSVKVKSITKRMKEKRFAAGANREAMKSIEKLGIKFPQFAELSLNSMEEISQVLGL